VLEEFMVQIEMQERDRRFAGRLGDPERAWAARQPGSAGQVGHRFGLAAVHRAAAAIVTLLLRSY